MESLFKIYSIGVVIKDSLIHNNYIDVYPIEKIPGRSDLLNPEDLSLSPNIAGIKVETPNGRYENVSIVKDNIIKAKWLGSNNRLECPNIRKGERVLLYTYQNSDEYYWTPFDNDFKYRKNEKLTITLSNRKKIMVDPSELDHVYEFSVDTMNKKVYLVTMDNDGEYTTHAFSLNTLEGVMKYYDGKSNLIMVESRKDKMTINMNKELDIAVGEKIITNTKKTYYNSEDFINIKTKDTYIESSNSMSIKTTTTALQSDESINLEATSINVKANKGIYASTPKTYFDSGVSLTLKSLDAFINSYKSTNLVSAITNIDTSGDLTVTTGGKHSVSNMSYDITSKTTHSVIAVTGYDLKSIKYEATVGTYSIYSMLGFNAKSPITDLMGTLSDLIDTLMGISVVGHDCAGALTPGVVAQLAMIKFKIQIVKGSL